MNTTASSSPNQSGNDWATWVEYLKSAGLKFLGLFWNIVQGDESLRHRNLDHIEAGGMPKFLIKKTRDMSATMRDLRCLGRDDAVMWVKYWKRAGLF